MLPGFPWLCLPCGPCGAPNSILDCRRWHVDCLHDLDRLQCRVCADRELKCWLSGLGHDIPLLRRLVTALFSLIKRQPTNKFSAAGFAWPGLTVSYTVEILPYKIRAKGLTLCFIFTSLAGIFNQWVNPVGIEALGWKFYLVYVVVLVLECLAIYFLYVETKGPTLEEIATLFDGNDANVVGMDRALDPKGDLESDGK